ncbi:GNAT family N-acetyltransferase [Pseudophaeobacter sp.]|uniref:GNAT family N-acetyltransferase n=1 Tax=Pseudophaeobacter sp. TaxID=1971739 RepID=UPI003296E737
MGRVMGADMDLTIRRYTPEDAETWAGFIRTASNATFLHERGFMDYHADRFTDHSLIFENDGKTLALLPANAVGKTLHSHSGLTYGGFLVAPATTAAAMVEIVSALRPYLRAQGFEVLSYKPSPHIFHTQPSEADLYALISNGARLVRSDLAAAIPLAQRLPFSSGRKYGAKKALKARLHIAESADLPSYWGILAEALLNQHDAQPTHSLDEITLLQARFPDKIRLFGTFDGDTMLAGTLIFDCGQAVHTQYIATSQVGREHGALDLLMQHLIGEVFAKRSWFSFGISTTNGGQDLNVGLSRQKEMFGGRSLTFNHYLWNLV